MTTQPDVSTRFEPVGALPDILIGPLERQHLDAVVRIHRAAFPNAFLSTLGLESVRRYYDWQLTGPHDVTAVRAEVNGEIVGFCIAGVFQGAMSGFLHNNAAYLAMRLVRRPWILLRREFRGRASTGLKILRRGKRRASGSAEQPKAPGNSARPFGILAIATEPCYQGRGVGKLLMAVCENVARQRNFSEMRLTVSTDNEQAIRFYLKSGWDRILNDGVWSGGMRRLLEPDVQ